MSASGSGTITPSLSTAGSGAGRIGRASRRPSASAIASETPPCAWSALVCAASSAQPARASVSEVRPFGVWLVNPCTPLR